MTMIKEVLKIMPLMNEKEMRSREISGNAHIYTPLLNEDETQLKLLDVFLEKTSGGSAKKLIMKALGNQKTTNAELDEIKAYIQKLNKERKEYD